MVIIILANTMLWTYWQRTETLEQSGKHFQPLQIGEKFHENQSIYALH